ncbi:hypothetical protein KCV01_g22660, partial [Aureobasidium melanogenum]
LDNVVEINGLPLEKQREEILSKRRHGMGFLGLGSTTTMLKMRYGSAEAVAFTEDVSREMAVAGWEVALDLAREKGPAPVLARDYVVTGDMLRKRPEMVADGWAVGDSIRGSVLHAKYSRYMQRVAGVAPELVAALAETGARFTHHTSIAPTGTISLSLANNASNGIEPSFAHHYSRNVIREGKKSKEKVEVYSYELLAYRALINGEAMPFTDAPKARLPDYFVAADDIGPKEHVDIQAASQKWIDSSISKTANVPTDYPYDDFKDIYFYAYKQGLKGCTTFRFNPAAFQGVLVKEADLESTHYRFELEDGSVVELKGNDEGKFMSIENEIDAGELPVNDIQPEDNVTTVTGEDAASDTHASSEESTEAHAPVTPKPVVKKKPVAKKVIEAAPAPADLFPADHADHADSDFADHPVVESVVKEKKPRKPAVKKAKPAPVAAAPVVDEAPVVADEPVAPAPVKKARAKKVVAKPAAVEAAPAKKTSARKAPAKKAVAAEETVAPA